MSHFFHQFLHYLTHWFYIPDQAASHPYGEYTVLQPAGLVRFFAFGAGYHGHEFLQGSTLILHVKACAGGVVVRGAHHVADTFLDQDGAGLRGMGNPFFVPGNGFP